MNVKGHLNSRNGLQEGDKYFYLGRKFFLTMGNYPVIRIHGEQLEFPQFLAFRGQKELTTWYIKQARDIITRRTNWYAGQMRTSFYDITFSDTRSQWGSCSKDNRLQFCWRLILAPLLVINYVVVHELAHTLEKNHSSFFWRKVRNVNPSYRQEQKWLQQFGHTLLLPHR